MERDYNMIRRRLANFSDKDVEKLLQAVAVGHGNLFYKMLPCPNDVELATGTPEVVSVKGKCQYEDCEAGAELIACGREQVHYSRDDKGHPEPRVYCLTHGRVVCDE